jgi:hypothetical protein
VPVTSFGSGVAATIASEAKFTGVTKRHPPMKNISRSQGDKSVEYFLRPTRKANNYSFILPNIARHFLSAAFAEGRVF